jgi:acetylornithine deacetylase/succinyl-diaminopimelate desuccinylase-like protein
MLMDASSSLRFLQSHFRDMIVRFAEFLRIPSVSTDPAYAPQVRQCAEWLCDYMREIGINNSQVLPTTGHPIVLGEYTSNSPAPTVLVYGHYDVQPPDPTAEWESDPFEMTIRDGILYARGSSDDKGQVFAILMALQSMIATMDALPCNLKILIEGEEEAGSGGILDYIDRQRESLRSATALICDTAMLSEQKPSLVVSLRGIVYADLIIRGAKRDLHSGVYGGAIPNPFHVLGNIIAHAHDVHRRITIPGFYDDVEEPSMEERLQLAEIPFNEREWLDDIGVTRAHTEEGYSVLESTTMRPTLDIHGIWGGYGGEGVKTIIPGTVAAKLSARLVAHQDPDRIFRLLDHYVADHIPASMSYELHRLVEAMPVSIRSDGLAMSAARVALENVFGCQPSFMREGGSIPIVIALKKHLGLEPILMGFGLESDAIHAPNEHISLNRLEKGAESVIHFLAQLAAGWTG